MGVKNAVKKLKTKSKAKLPDVAVAAIKSAAKAGKKAAKSASLASGKKALLNYTNPSESIVYNDFFDSDCSDADVDGDVSSKNTKQKVLVCSSKGIPHRPRHLMRNLIALMPHSRKDSSLADKKQISELNEIADLKNCTKVMYFETRKGTDLYMWLSNAPVGPSVKFQVYNDHTLDELKMTGNHLLGSRSILAFDSSFDEYPHLKLIKELLKQTFNVPYRCRNSKPFFDHILQFAIIDSKIWIRNYQIVAPADRAKLEEVSLSEVGPRLVIDPIRIFAGSFGGESLWSNADYVTPGERQRLANAEEKRRAMAKVEQSIKSKVKSHELKPPADPLSDTFK